MKEAFVRILVVVGLAIVAFFSLVAAFWIAVFSLGVGAVTYLGLKIRRAFTQKSDHNPSNKIIITGRVVEEKKKDLH